MWSAKDFLQDPTWANAGWLALDTVSLRASFVYDADGNRVKGTVGGVTTVYIGGIYEYAGGAAKSYYTGPGGVVAMRSGGTVYYLFQTEIVSDMAW